MTSPAARVRTRKPAVRPDLAGLNRDSVVTAAVQLIDAEGIDAFGVRGLARQLGVSTATVYWHVGGRTELLAAVVGRVLEDAMPTSPNWPDGVQAFAHRLRNTLHEHPNVAPLFGADLTCNRAVPLDVVESLLASLSAGGVAKDRLVSAYNALVGSLIGFVTVELAVPPTAAEAEAFSEQVRAHLGEVDPELHPHLSASHDQWENSAFGLRWSNGAERPMDDAFELLVSSLVAGLPLAGQRTTARRTPSTSRRKA